MNFPALAMVTLRMYASVVGYSDAAGNSGALERAALEEVENDIVSHLKDECHVYLNAEHKKELLLLLQKHGAMNRINCQLLEQFFCRCNESMYDDMVDTAVTMYAPVAAVAGHYDTLASSDKNKVTRIETRILSTLESKYNLLLDFGAKADFRELIKKHGSDGAVNRKLLRQFFVGCKSKFFDKLALLISSSSATRDVTKLRRGLQADPDLFSPSCCKKPVTKQQPAHNSPVCVQKRIAAGKAKK